MYLAKHLIRVVLTLVMVGIATVLIVAVWHTYMIAPWTRDGRVQAEVVDIAPEIPGTVVSVPVHDNQYVHKGDVLFALDPVRFRIAIAGGRASVDGATQQLRLDQSDANRRKGLTGIVSAEEQQK